MSISYSLLPPPFVPPQQRATWVKSTAKDLLKGGSFLRFGIDKNVSDLVLIATLLTARSTGENEEFRPSCPLCYLHCLLLHRALPDRTEAARSVPHAVAYIMLGLSCHSGNMFSSPQSPHSVLGYMGLGRAMGMPPTRCRCKLVEKLSAAFGETWIL